jgi:hypothetical protein
LALGFGGLLDVAVAIRSLVTRNDPRQPTFGAADGIDFANKNMEHTQAMVPMSPVVQAQTNGFASPDRHFDEIKEELKLWYLRNKKPGDAVRFLTIRGQKSE